MSFINDKTREINCKIVYYGPAKSGKTTTLRRLYTEIAASAKGEMISLAEDNDHTLFFDFVPVNIGTYKGYTIRVHLYTVPGEIGYQQSRALISKGVDGVVFIADSTLERMENNLKSLDGLKEILRREGMTWGEVPCVVQYNKRDVAGALPVEEIRTCINKDGFDEFETVATTGSGVFDTFRAISMKVLKALRQEEMAEAAKGVS